MNLAARDHQHIWHPCSQMKDYETFKPLEVVRAEGCYLELNDGTNVIDAISSWWCKSLGHKHPRLLKALQHQANQFEHVIFANTTNKTIVDLSEKLCRLTSSLQKVFYAGDGSSAVEIAMKMSLHVRKIQDEPHKKLFLALENAYHGETFGALSVSDVGIYRDSYQAHLLPAHFISSVPYVEHVTNKNWLNCAENWAIIEKQLEQYREQTTAIIVEPIVQGAGGMKIYSQDLLRRLRAWTKLHGIHLIADEIMTGIGRTGKMLACEHATIEPDFLCLAKGLTSGYLPFSAMLTTQAIYDTFYADYELGKSFLHSHTYSGNALGASVALEVMKVMEEENICARVCGIETEMLMRMREIAQQTGRLKNVRGIGAMVAADLVCDEGERMGYRVYQAAVKKGALLRPLGNTIYWLPPFTIDSAALSRLQQITADAIVCTA